MYCINELLGRGMAFAGTKHDERDSEARIDSGCEGLYRKAKTWMDARLSCPGKSNVISSEKFNVTCFDKWLMIITVGI